MCGYRGKQVGVLLLVGLSLLLSYKRQAFYGQEEDSDKLLQEDSGSLLQKEDSPVGSSVVTSCTGNQEEGWRRESPEEAALAWVASVTSTTGHHQVKAHNFHTSGRYFTPWLSGEDKPSGPSDGGAWDWDDYNNELLLTIGKFQSGLPVGLAWQRRSNSPYDGWLYGQVDSSGEFSGGDITFLYPGMRRGLRGQWKKGRLVTARGVQVTGTRCKEGLLELYLEEVGERVHWVFEDREEWIGSHPTVMDPNEKDNVYIGRSGRANTTSLVQGLFARRAFLPNQLVSYYSGVKRTDSKMEDMISGLSEEKQEEMEVYQYDFGAEAPVSWGYDKNLMIDVPLKYRSTSAFTTTLGHKVNHKFIDTNVDFRQALHPVFGGVVCVVANTVILPGQELFVNYGYHRNADSYEDFLKNLDSYSQWYLEEFKKVPKKEQKQLFDDN